MNYISRLLDYYELYAIFTQETQKRPVAIVRQIGSRTCPLYYGIAVTGFNIRHMDCTPYSTSSWPFQFSITGVVVQSGLKAEQSA